MPTKISTDDKARLALAAMRMLTGTAGGGAHRGVDSSNGSTFAALVDGFLIGWKAERDAAKRTTELRVWGCDLLPGDEIAISTTRGMETYEAPVASADTDSSTCVSYQRTDGTRGNVAADERLWVRRRVGG